MKRSLVLLMALLIALLSGCSFGGNQTPTDGSNNAQNGATVAADNENQSDFNEEEIVKNIKVTSYRYTSYSYNYLILVLKNNSKVDCKLEVSVDLYDDKGDIVGTEDSTIQAFAAGTETLVKFSTKDKFKKFEYQLSADKISSYYTAVCNDLKCKVNKATDKIIVSVTNKGQKTAKYTKANAIFFKGKKVVYCNLAYVGDSKNLIKPGKTEKAQITCYEKFDSYKVYLDSYADNNAS